MPRDDQKPAPHWDDQKPAPLWDDLTEWSAKAGAWAAAYHRHKRDLPVRARVAPGDIAAQLPDSPPEGGEDMTAILEDFERILLPGMTHWQHPRFFAYFCNNATPPTALADFLIATLSPQCILWQAAPAATELETRMLEWLRQAVGLPDTFQGVIQGTASEATLAAVLTMRERALDWAGNRDGLAGQPKLRLYTTAEVHPSVDRAVWVAGIGDANLIRLPVKGPLRGMDPDALAAAIRDDRAAGHLPIGVLACLGGTAMGACDPLDRIAEITARENLYLHVDAAWAGNAMICPELRPLWAGIEGADSLVFNPYKWLGAQAEGSIHFLKHPEDLRRTLAYQPEYLKGPESDVINYSEWTVPLGRRFRALKLWFLIRAYGLDGLRGRIRNHIRWSTALCDRLRAHPRFEIVTEPILSLFTFRVPGDDAAQRAFVERVNRDGRIMITPADVAGQVVCRFQVGQFDTLEEDVALAYEVLVELGEN
ncbi:MAG: pyridoxal-dependent decarboxylase [Silicimonas sp.]|nr:pyridoxal-dependent decarboxylase [Silicimonas sp.]